LLEDIEVFYADESGFEEHYSRTYGYSLRGERVYGKVSGTRYARTSSALLLRKSRLWRSAFLPMHIVGAIDQNNDFIAGFALATVHNYPLVRFSSVALSFSSETGRAACSLQSHRFAGLAIVHLQRLKIVSRGYAPLPVQRIHEWRFVFGLAGTCFRSRTKKSRKITIGVG